MTCYRYDARERRRGALTSLLAGALGLHAAALATLLIHYGPPTTLDRLGILGALHVAGLLLLLPALIVVTPIHEAIHYAAWRLAGVPARFGWTPPATPHVRVADDRPVPAVLARHVLLAPLVVITAAGSLMALAAPPPTSSAALLAVAVNAALSVTDMRMRRLLSPHRDRQIIDRPDGFDVR